MPNEVEVSIFGGGYGESILVHPGNNEWIIIDSFRSPYTKRPVALEYLEKLNVNINEAVKLIVATHWHDDHVGGLSEIVDVCKNASFVTPGAISSKEFLNFLYADIDLKEKRYGNKELGVILEEYNQRNKTVVLATENKRILNRPFYEVYSLAPSDYSTLNAIKEIATLLPEEHKPRKAIPNPKVNNSSIVLLIIVNGEGILLGGDIEETNNLRQGWLRIINSCEKPQSKSFLFKISHHGSKNSHHDGIWINLLNKESVSFLTAFSLGNNSLPSESDIKRILSKTDNAWITSNPRQGRRVCKRDRTTEKTIKQSVKSIKSLSDEGHIRIRRRHGEGKYEIELFGTASKLQNCV
ncbi:MBL fold metallo-hydrolase [Candidatus Pacearchaeota archaeon]|nr:MBL fold metallo-hydrolase [Candidatus Pacearchaeota archaeon]